MILKKKNQVGGRSSLLNFKTDCIVTGIKTVWSWWKDTDIDQWNEITKTNKWK